MSSKEVDKSQLLRYITIEKEIHQLESKNVLKNYDVRKKTIDDVGETIRTVEITLKQLQLQTKKEKADVDNMQKQSIKDMFKDQGAFQQQLTREQEEYLEAKNKEEVTRQQFLGLQKQKEELEAKASDIKEPADKLKGLYEERDTLLSDIFNGEYGSPKENELEALFDQLMEKKERVSVANYKWTSARVLLQHAVNQLIFAVKKWEDIVRIPPQNQKDRYVHATDVRNNLIAAMQNVQSTQRYLNTIEFPYCKPEEMATVQRAVNNIYTGAISLTSKEQWQKNNKRGSSVNGVSTIEFAATLQFRCNDRHKHAHQCYHVTMRRASALMQWFDNVISGTIQKDLKSVTEEARKIEQQLRAERIKLIREKLEESGESTKDLNDAGLKGLTDQSQLKDSDTDMQGIGITRPEAVGDDKCLPDAQQQMDEHGPPPPTPLPLSELAPMPSENALFGDISELKEEYKKNTEEFMKTQELNKARMSQGLEAKLQARRHKKMK